MSKVIELRQPSFSGKSGKPTPPRKPKNADVRSREHLTPGEVDKLLSTAGKLGRHGHRDKTLVLITYRHGLRVSELIALRWDQVDLNAGLVHINRRKNGTPSTHPLSGTEIRALRRLQRDYPATQYVFVTERKGPMTDSAVRKLVARAGREADLGFPAHPHMLRHACGFKLANDGHDTRAIQYTEMAPDRFKDFWGD
jgi:type 1 fimbriae regulatory protein FimB/type 1 fimbriae regulatory protein FimE